MTAGRHRIWLWQGGLLAALLVLWQLLTTSGILSPFFFGDPRGVFSVLRAWLIGGELYPHLGVTVLETLCAFLGGTALGVVLGLWLGLSPGVGRLLAPYLKAANAMPRVVLAPIFAMWFGLGMGSKIALGITLVFFSVFFNVLQGVREVSPAVLANARMLGAGRQQLLRHVYWPAATSWVFSGLHTSIGMAFVGAVVGEYLGSARGVGYLILQAEGVFDINAVIAGIVVLTACALALDAWVTWLERRLLIWHPQSGGLQ